MLPALSILLPTFNGAPYLREQLDSITAQTFSNFELLAIDDGSSDGTVAILREYANADARITLLRSTGNTGHKARLAELLRHASAEWIAISDQDDVWARDKLEKLTEAVGGASLAFGRSELIDSNGRPLGSDLLTTLRSQRRPDDRLLTVFRPQISGHAMIARREVFSHALFYHDEPFDWLIGLLAEFSRGVVYVPDAVVHHRLHDTNSHNVTIRVRTNPLLIRPRHLRLLLQRRNRARERLLAAAQFLARSDVVPANDRAIFADLAAACVAAWQRRRSTMTKGTLRKLILARLRPFAGSASDFRRAARYVSIAVHGHLHPRVMLGLYRLEL
jgi:glycosyltransferase involved in cell wall biosynthesis